MKRIITSIVLSATALLVSQAYGASVARKVKPECSKAHAVFFVTKSEYAEAGMARVRNLLEKSKKHIDVVDGEPEGAHKIQLKQYGYKWGENKAAVVGHCAHGGTCNEAAEIVAAENAGTPSVYCGPLPVALE